MITITCPNYRDQSIDSLHARSVVLNLVGGTEPHKFHTCIHRTLRSWKNKMCVVIFIFLNFYCFKISCRRTPEIDSSNPWDSIEPWLRTTVLDPALKAYMQLMGLQVILTYYENIFYEFIENSP